MWPPHSAMANHNRIRNKGVVFGKTFKSFPFATILPALETHTIQCSIYHLLSYSNCCISYITF